VWYDFMLYYSFDTLGAGRRQESDSDAAVNLKYDPNGQPVVCPERDAAIAEWVYDDRAFGGDVGV